MERNSLFNLDYIPNQSFLECVDNLNVPISIKDSIKEIRKK